MEQEQSIIISVIKDLNVEAPIPTIWRSTISEIVNAFIDNDFSLSRSIKRVLPVSDASVKQIENYILDYGEKLIPLPNETWDTSICTFSNNQWDLIIDLWTKNEGPSDLILQLNVFENADDYLFEIYMVYVP